MNTLDLVPYPEAYRVLGISHGRLEYAHKTGRVPASHQTWQHPLFQPKSDRSHAGLLCGPQTVRTCAWPR